MKRKIVVLLIILSIMAPKIAQADSFWASIQNSYKESLLKSYKWVLVKQCAGNNATPRKLSICECCADQAAIQLPIEQLKDPAASKEYIRQYILPACTEKNS